MPRQSPQGFLGALLRTHLWTDAVRFLAHALPVPDGVDWAVMCARTALGKRLTPIDAACLDRAGIWAATPTEDHRLRCLDAAREAMLSGAPALAALAAYWSVPTATPELELGVSSPDQQSHAAVGASVLLSVALGNPMRAEERFRVAIARGMEVADGGIDHRPEDAVSA